MKRFATHSIAMLAGMLAGMLVMATAGCGDSAVEDENAEPAKTQQETTTEPAAPGMGKKGRGYGHGPVGTPLKAMRFAEESLALSQVKHNLEIYRGLHGDYPKTHEEFIKEIIEAGMIELPELPEGQRYVYVPEDHQLKIEHPR